MAQTLGLCALRALLLLGLLLAGLGGNASAQTLELKRAEFELPDPGACPTATPVTTSRIAPRSVTDSLLAAASAAAILGDHAAAAELFRAAVANDPSNPVIAYRFARTLDDQGEAQAAILEYCRYLALAPTANDATEIRDRIRDLALDRLIATAEEWKREGAAGIAAYDRGEYRLAVDAFSRLVTLRPEWAVGYYNRSVGYLAFGDRARAVADLETYLALLPSGSSDSTVVRELGSLRPSVASGPLAGSGAPLPVARPMVAPGGALIRGLIVPGFGQFSTGRSALGLIVLGAAGGAVYYGTISETETRRETGVDPFGNSYDYDVTYRARPNQTVGFAAAAGIAIVAAVESYLYAGRRQSVATDNSPVPEAPVAVRVGRSAEGLGAELSVRIMTPRN